MYYVVFRIGNMLAGVLMRRKPVRHWPRRSAVISASPAPRHQTAYRLLQSLPHNVFC